MFKLSPDKEYQTCSSSRQTWYLNQLYTLLINYLAVIVHYNFYNLNTCLKISITVKHWCQTNNRKEQAMQVVANSRERKVSG